MGKNASFAGIGRNNVRYIETNEKGEMCSESLQTAIKDDLNNKLIPFFVNATVGTTRMRVMMDYNNALPYPFFFYLCFC